MSPIITNFTKKIVKDVETNTPNGQDRNNKEPQEIVNDFDGKFVTNDECSEAAEGEYCIFNCGPAKIPKQVLQRIKKEFVNYDESGQSIVEISEEMPQLEQIVTSTAEKIRKLLNVPNNYKILFMQCGGSGQFSAVAMNLIGKTGKADYIVTGNFSYKAMTEAKKYGKINEVFPSCINPTINTNIPDPSTWNLDKEASYLYFCANETVNCVEFQYLPESLDFEKIPLVADMSSNLFSKQIDISKFGIIFTAAQKNLGPSGITLVIIREDLLGYAMPFTPTIFDYKIMADHNSMYNTPATFPIYSMSHVLDWIEANGGIKGMEQMAFTKSSLIYNLIDNSNGFYSSPVEKKCRSRMNIKFHIQNGCGKLENEFVSKSKQVKMIGISRLSLAGGGIRLGLYIAVPLKHVERLVEFMKWFMVEYN